MNNIILEEKLNDTYIYLDNVYICGKNQNEHDINLIKWNKIKTK